MACVVGSARELACFAIDLHLVPGMLTVKPNSMGYYFSSRVKTVARLLVSRWVRLGTISALCLCFLSLYASLRAQKYNHLDKLIGSIQIPGMEEEGFYATEETGGRPFRWTNGAGKLVVPLRGAWPRAVTLMLSLSVPRPLRLVIRCNGNSLFDDTVQPQETWVRTFNARSLPRGTDMTLEICSDVFVPAWVNRNSDDNRKLGVRFLGVLLHSEEHSFLNTPFGSRIVLGIEDSGLYQPEQETDGQLFRWTNGDARLVVPISKAQPKALAVVLDIPPEAAGRLAFFVNGRRLMDELSDPQNQWTRTFPLQQEDLAESLMIHVQSASWIPAHATAGSTDQRLLGVKIKRMTLLD